MGTKPKNTKLKKNDKECDYDKEIVKEIFSTISQDFKDHTQQRRLIVRKPSGEIALEMPVAVGVVLSIAALCFFLPGVIIALIYGYHNKLQLEVISDISDEEASMIDMLENHDTVHGLQYEMGDGQATMAQ